MIGQVRVVTDIAVAFRTALDEAAPRTLALSGGDTARRCYEALAQSSALDWSRVEVLFGDERWVPVDDDASNEGMARRALLDRVPVATVHSVRGAGPTIEAAAAAYDRLVARLDGIDVIHLGLGEDGHTASLFPGSPTLDVTDRYVVPTAHVDFPRVTFTRATIAAGRLVVVTVAGTSKRDAFQRVREHDPTAPATLIDAEHVVWIVDEAAAG